MPTRGREGHDMGKPEVVPAHPAHERDTDHPGYEIQDVNVGGVVTFVGGLAAFLLVFFIFCFVMGKGINYWIAKQDGNPDKWQQGKNLSEPGYTPRGEKRQDLTSNAALEQRQLNGMTQAFPTPRLETDDGNQDTADLHAREDLLLNYYSQSSDLPQGTVRIPIAQAMQLVVSRGLPKAAAAGAPQVSASTQNGPGATTEMNPATMMAGEHAPVVVRPLTNGFARTGYELDTIEAREQKLMSNAALEAKR